MTAIPLAPTAPLRRLTAPGAGAALALVLVLSPAAQPARAADADGRFVVKGAALTTCEQFTKARAERSQLLYLYAAWLEGYLSALNERTPETYDLVAFESTELLVALLDSNCKQRPREPFFNVVRALVRALHPQRVTRQTPLVEARVGERSVRLYAEVLRRVQERLAALGLYKGAPDGKFGPATRKALETWQKENGLEPTGLPDQLTVLRILRGGSGAPAPATGAPREGARGPAAGEEERKAGGGGG